jgi:hypothetical protein
VAKLGDCPKCGCTAERICDAVRDEHYLLMLLGKPFKLDVTCPGCGYVWMCVEFHGRFKDGPAASTSNNA